MWSTILRFDSSGTRWSKQRLPASMWKIGMWRFFAAIVQRQLFVSPSTRKAPGFSASSTGSIASRIFPAVSVAFRPAACRKWSGRRRPRSLKNTSFSS